MRRPGRRRAVRCRSPRSRSRSCRGCTAANPTRGRALARVCLPHDWLTWKLTGAFVTDRGDASGTGYFSAAHDEYALDLLAIVDATSTGRRGSRACCSRPSARARRSRSASTRSSRRVPATTWRPRSRSALRPGDVAISLGTSGTVYTVSESPTADASGAVAGFADATGRFLPLVCTLNATKVTDTMARWLGVDHAASRCARARCLARRRRSRRRPVLRRRAHAEPARRVGSDLGAAHRHDARATRARARSRAWCAGCSTVSMR